MITNTHSLPRTIAVILVRLNEKNFLDTFSINAQIFNLMQIFPVAAQFDADRETEGQTDRTKLIVA